MLCTRKTISGHCTPTQLLGFNLIELMVVIAIMSLLSVIAIPVYTSHLAKTNRLAAEQQLIRIATALERYQIEHQTYIGATFEQLKENNQISNGSYHFEIISLTQNNFVLQAIPNDKQKSHDSCNNLQLDSDGKKSSCW